jgi:ligand-binding sensor domain-containing protein
VGTAAGLDRWQPERGAFMHFRHDAKDPHSLGGNQVSQIIEDQNGSLWVGTFDGGLDRMDRGGHIIESFRHDAQRATSLGSGRKFNGSVARDVAARSCSSGTTR